MSCDPFLHSHRERCNRLGYINGYADALADIEALAAAEPTGPDARPDDCVAFDRCGRSNCWYCS